MPKQIKVEPTDEGHHWCSSCNQFVDPAGFHKRPRRWNGLDTNCIACKRKKNERWRRARGSTPREEYLKKTRKPGYCPDCDQWKNLTTDFYKAANRPNGHQNICKQCTAKRNSHHWNVNIKGNKEVHVAIKKSNNQYQKKYREKPDVIRKKAVRALTQQALKGGFIAKQPCESCGTGKVEAHHDDYTKPLEVRWLCRKCHRSEHSRK